MLDTRCWILDVILLFYFVNLRGLRGYNFFNIRILHEHDFSFRH